MITVKNLSKSFKNNDVLHCVNLQLNTKVYGLLGANGAGKTTLIRCIAGLYEPQKGEILYNNEPIRKSKSFHQGLGYLPQVFGMFQELTLYEMMDYICSLKGIEKNKCTDEITKALTRVNLEDKAGDKVKTLSGGMVRRAGIAQAILGDTKIMLLDEPTAGLDPGERANFKNTISELKKNKIILISTHIVEDVDACCNSVIVIDKGNVLFKGSCEELRNIAINKVYQINEAEADANSIVGDKYKLKVNEIEGKIYHRILAKEKQDYQSEKPTLEDGYMCLVKGLA
ncbi:ATP-binding cassette domain-containing protein [Candidatus Contubernalis alkaliaceticus]|uniref:ATP-binding cassette domain-containing protein n=1 Tax=Candidatus Contubernalis alkaliaceticus TaxID=338645 RepID=UPI001F4C0486|nr:ATP-binding cassette domain-containing protein [Candidatus Contubernalis alkalaceticus]UNC91049.1 ATP-binding cassette domain-containing protein [Candidatus Contubernalis alkalaceticus]